MLRSRTALAALVLACFGVAGCSSDGATVGSDDRPGDTCSVRDPSDPRQTTVKTFDDAARALRDRIADVEGKFYFLCKQMDTELGLDSTETSTVLVCATLHERVRAAVDAGGQVAVVVTPSCITDASAQADCEAACALPGACDLATQCTDGEVVTACEGACSVCTGHLDCPGRSECHEACRARTLASVDCSEARMSIVVENAPELKSVLELHAEEWAELAALTGALAEPILSFGGVMLDSIGTGNYIWNFEQACFVEALGAVVVAVTSTHAALQSTASLDPAAVLPEL